LDILEIAHMDPWLQPAIDYIHDWIELQVRGLQQPGCIVAIAHRGKIVAEYAFGHANLTNGEQLTPRHRFRIASHAKSFTAAHEKAVATEIERRYAPRKRPAR
jgi:CubicO group peptidase (beta-lactamase class C family)